ncbi:MAG: DUF1841 family protein [Woeseiaceae bacterium]|nr:DUF1841 family protein [Woeseiaceae bacterium]
MFGQDRSGLRRMYRDAWRKQAAGELLSPLEAQIAAVIAEHPEYQTAVEDDLEAEFTVEGGKTNPFLHMGLHLGIREQVATDRPQGIAAIYRSLAARHGDQHTAEHAMIDCLAEALWDAGRRNEPPDEIQYLENLRRLAD